MASSVIPSAPSVSAELKLARDPFATDTQLFGIIEKSTDYEATQVARERLAARVKAAEVAVTVE